MSDNTLKKRVEALRLYGVLEHWDEADSNWIALLVNWEETARNTRSLDRRLQNARLPAFKSLTEFDWSWPSKCDRREIEDLMTLAFTRDASNVILCGPNAVGKSTIACNLAYQAVVKGHSARFVTAADMLTELAQQESAGALGRRLTHYAKPSLLVIDELGYLSYSNQHADLLFQVISKRYLKCSTVVTTNRPFTEWSEIFPNATCVVTLIDRLVHRSEIISIEAKSYRLKEAEERQARKRATKAAPIIDEGLSSTPVDT